MIEHGERIPSLQVIRELARRLEVSEVWLARGLEESESDGDQRLVDAELAIRMGEVGEARRLAMEVIGSGGGAVGRARAHAVLGQAAFAEDDAAPAIGEFERALELDEALCEDPTLADSLGRAYARVGEVERAIALFRQNLERADRLGDPAEQLRFAVLLANALIDLSRLAEASELLSRVIRSESAADPVALARIYWTESRLHAMKQQPDSARRFARRALNLLEATEHRHYRSRAHQLLAFVELDAGNAEEALKLIRRGRELASESGTEYDAAKFAIEEARALLMLGRVDEAASLAMAASSGFAAAHPWDLGRSYSELASAFEQADESARALELYELAIEILEPQPSRYLGDTYRSYAALLEREGREKDAFAAYKSAADTLHALNRLSGSPA